MEFERNERAEDALVKKWYNEMSDGRDNQALGVTDYVYCLTKAYYKKTFLPQPPGRKLTLIFAMGLWLEKVILGKDQNATAGELDGIGYHTDDLSWNVDGEPKLGEVKSSNLSAKKDFSELNPAWHKQFLSYLKTTKATVGSFIVLHKRGDYRAGPFTDPDIRIWDVTATQEEIDDNWTWMLGRKYILDEALKDHIPPDPFTWRAFDWMDYVEGKEDYECKECPFLSLCENREKGLV